MKTKLKSIAVVMALVTLVSSFSAFSASAKGLTYSVTSAKGKKGDTVTVSVKISSDIEIWGANLMLEYNPSELEVVECKTGSAAATGSLHNTGSSVNFSGMFASQSGTVYTVKFKILKGYGSANISLKSTENTYLNGKTYSSSIKQGKITVDNPATGDVNNDGNVTAVDARYVLQAVAGIKTLNSSQKKLVDMNGDGKITAVDARFILQVVAGLR
jgi:hypothetical protein